MQKKTKTIWRNFLMQEYLLIYSFEDYKLILKCLWGNQRHEVFVNQKDYEFS